MSLLNCLRCDVVFQPTKVEASNWFSMHWRWTRHSYHAGTRVMTVLQSYVDILCHVCHVFALYRSDVSFCYDNKSTFCYCK